MHFLCIAVASLVVTCLLYTGYSWAIHGVFVGYSWGIHMYRLCVGYVSVMYRLCIGTDTGKWGSFDNYGIISLKEIETPARYAHEILINLITTRLVAYCVLRNELQPLLATLRSLNLK